MNTNVLDALFSFDSQTPTPPTHNTALSTKLVPSLDSIVELPIILLDDFATAADRQPFRDYTAEEMDELKQDISHNGIIQPLIVRPKADHRYEIIAGHNRRTGAREIGYKSVPCIVRELSDEDAVLQMVATNLQQRKKLLPSEKAFAYKMQLDAMKRQGYRADLTSCQVGTKLRSDEKLAEEVSDSSRQIQRYIRLTYLIPSLLKKVDERKLGLTVAETLSYLSTENQTAVERYCFQEHDLYISQKIADSLRQAADQGTTLDDAALSSLVQVTVKTMRGVSIPERTIRQYFPENTPKKYIELTISKALATYFGK